MRDSVGLGEFREFPGSCEKLALNAVEDSWDLTTGFPWECAKPQLWRERDESPDRAIGGKTPGNRREIGRIEGDGSAGLKNRAAGRIGKVGK